MQGNRRIKAIIVLAILLIVSLLVLSTYLMVNISNKRKELAKQEIEITKLENKLNYYENQQDANNKDDKNSDIEIIVPGEE